MMRCVVIGGGTGSFTVLSGLKNHVTNISALVSMADDGGSTGALRDELGVLPPGDVRQCLVALSEAPQELQELFNYRFDKGTLAGHSFGNIFLSAIEKTAGSFSDAVRIASDILRIRGEVLPITHDNVRLAISWVDGTIARGQGRIDTMRFVAGKGRPELHLEPAARISNEADRAIRQADWIVIAPGDLYTSLGPLLVVDGVAEALAATSAKILYVANLTTKLGQTSKFTAADHATEIERFAGGPILNYVLYNTAQPSKTFLQRYAKQGEELVEADTAQLEAAHYKSVGAQLIARHAPKRVKADALDAHRSYIRHDPNALAHALLDVFSTDKKS